VSVAALNNTYIGKRIASYFAVLHALCWVKLMMPEVAFTNIFASKPGHKQSWSGKDVSRVCRPSRFCLHYILRTSQGNACFNVKQSCENIFHCSTCLVICWNGLCEICCW